MLDDAARERRAARLPRQRARSCASGSAGQRSSALRRDSAASCGNRRTQPLSRRPGSFPVQMCVQEQVAEQMGPGRSPPTRTAGRSAPEAGRASGPLSARPGGRRRPRWRSLGLALLPRAPARTGLRLLRVPSRPRLGTGPLPPPTRFCSPGRRLGSPAFEKPAGRQGDADESQHCPPGLGPPSGEWRGGGVGLVQGKPAGGARPSTRAGQQGRCRPEAPGGRWWARFHVSHPHTARREPSASDV